MASGTGQRGKNHWGEKKGVLGKSTFEKEGPWILGSKHGQTSEETRTTQRRKKRKNKICIVSYAKESKELNKWTKD